MSTSPKPSPPPRRSKQTNNRERLPDQNRAADGTVPPELNPQPAVATAAGSPATGTAVTTQTTTPQSVGQGMSTTAGSTNAGAAGDVGNWKEEGGRGTMHQPSPSKDPPSPQSSPQQNQIETQQIAPPINNTMDTPSPQLQQPIGLRSEGGPMHMGPPPRSMMHSYILKDGNFSSSSNKDPIGKNVLREAAGEMTEFFIEAWNNIRFTIRLQGQQPINFDATGIIGLPALLQFALTSEEQKAISLGKLRKQNISYKIESDSIEFFLTNKAEVHWNEDELKKYLINALITAVLDEIVYAALRKDEEETVKILEEIKKTKPPEIRSGKILIYFHDNDIYIIGFKDGFRQFSKNILQKLTQSTAESAESTSISLLSAQALHLDDIDCLKNLELISDIERDIPGVKFSSSMPLTISGTFEKVTKANEILNLHRTVTKRHVVFKDPVCADLFMNKNVRNDTVCNLVKMQVLKQTKLGIKKCYIKVLAGETPNVFVYCMNKEEADEAASLISTCLCVTKISKKIYEIIKDDLGNLGNNQPVFLLLTDKMVLLVSTKDVAENLNHMIVRNIPKTETEPVPPLVCKYFTDFGASLLEKLLKECKVSVKVDQDFLIFSGLPRNIKEARQLMKENYFGQQISLNTDYALTNEEKSQLDDVSRKYKCCWNTKPYASGRSNTLKDVKYLASWLRPSSNARLTLIEGSPVEVDFDVLLVFVTDSLFPIISKKQLQNGYEGMLEYSRSVAGVGNKGNGEVGVSGLYPGEIMKDFFRSKQVMYFVVQKATETKDTRSMTLPPNLGLSIKQASHGSTVASVGIPVGTDGLLGTFTEQQLCEQISLEWIREWSNFHDMPELFICPTNTTENVMEIVDRSFQKSKGFSRINFSTFNDKTAVNAVEVDVVIENLLNSKAEVIVNTTARTLDLEEGYISNLILKNGGITVQEECRKKYPNGIQYAEVAITGSGNLQQTAGIKYICHSSLKRYKTTAYDMAVDCVKNFVRNCLYAAETLDVKSIAFPALGTGKLGYPRRDVACAMFDAVEEYNVEAVNKSLRRICFMLNGKDEAVCEAFQNEKWRRSDYKRRKEHVTGPAEMCLKKREELGNAEIEFTVRMNIHYPPPQFVEVSFRESASEMETPITIQSAKTHQQSWNDRLTVSQCISDEHSFRKVVDLIINKTDEDKITGLVIYPLTTSNFKATIGDQIKTITSEVENLALQDGGVKKLVYLREIWFVVDESGFCSAEENLLSGKLQKISNFLKGRTSWEKVFVTDTSKKVSLNIIGPSRKAVESAATEMKAIFGKRKQNSQIRPPLQTGPDRSAGFSNSTNIQQLEESPVLVLSGNARTYESQGASPKETGMSKLHDVVPSEPDLSRTDNKPSYMTPSFLTGPDRSAGFSNSTNIQQLEESPVLVLSGNARTYESQGARPKETGMSKLHDVVPSEPDLSRTDSQPSHMTPSFLDTIEVKANINQGIIAFLEARGANQFSIWKNQVCKVFKVSFGTGTEESTIHGSFTQVKLLQEYLTYDFPNYPECIGKEIDNVDLKKSIVEEDITQITTNSKYHVVFQYRIHKVLVYVYKDDLTVVKADCIVSSASPQLSGKMGLEKALLDNAGPEVKKECKDFITDKRNLDVGKTLMTNGGRLKCKKILHFNSHGMGENKLMETIKLCISEAEKQSLFSLAISGMGLGLSKKPECFGKSLFDAISTLSQRHDSLVEAIHFVEKSTSLLTSVMEAFTTAFSCLGINKTKIYVAKGDVTALKADAIVVFQDSKFSLQNTLAKKVADLSGSSFMTDVEVLRSQTPRIGKVYTLKAKGDLFSTCRIVLHAIVYQDKSGDKFMEPVKLESFKKTIKKILGKSKENKVVTLGIPVIQMEGLSEEEVSNTLAEVIIEYFCTSDTVIETVHILNEDNATVQHFVSCLQKQAVDKIKENKGRFLSSLSSREHAVKESLV